MNATIGGPWPSHVFLSLVHQPEPVCPCRVVVCVRQDIWSLGGAVLQMATGHPPWHSLNLRTPVALINWVKRTDGPPPLPQGLSEALTSFLLRCFERDPTKRATATQLLWDPFVAESHVDAAAEPFAPGHDADGVSDIDNLSRAAAIARIRRASLPDYTRSPSRSPSPLPSSPLPNSSTSSSGARSPSGAHVGRDRVGRCGHMMLPERQEHLQSATDQSLGGGASEASAPPPGRDPTPIPRSSSTRRAALPSIDVGTASPDPSLSPVGGPRVMTPTRRHSGGTRGGSSSPNPFGGRRRSLDNPDTSRSPRNAAAGSAGAAAQLPSPSRQGADAVHSTPSERGGPSRMPCATTEEATDEGAQRGERGRRASRERNNAAVTAAGRTKQGSRDLNGGTSPETPRGGDGSRGSSRSRRRSGDHGDGEHEWGGGDAVDAAHRSNDGSHGGAVIPGSLEGVHASSPSRPRKAGRGERPGSNPESSPGSSQAAPAAEAWKWKG